MADESGWSPNRAGAPISVSPSQHEQPSDPIRRVWIIEDHEADVFLIREALSAGMSAQFVVLDNGADAATLLRMAGDPPACPDLVILDLNLPGLAGGEVLRLLRSGIACREVPVIVVTSSDSREDRAMVLGLGANAYFRKPSDFDSFMKLGGVAIRVLEESSGS